MGTDADKPLVLQQRSGSIELKTAADNTPKPAYVTQAWCVRVLIKKSLMCIGV